MPLNQLGQQLAEPGTVLWVDVDADRPGADPTWRRLADQLGVDARLLNTGSERPHTDLEHAPGCVPIVTAAVRLEPTTGALTTTRVTSLVTDRALVTVPAPGLPWDALTGMWNAAPELAAAGPARLLYGLLDEVVDSHLLALELLDDALEEVENDLFDTQPSPELQRRYHVLRKSLGQLRRVVLPARETTTALLRPDLHLIPPTLQPDYRDLHAHTQRAAAWTDSLEDLVTTIFQTTVVLSDHQLNTTMRQLAAWAAVIAVPTAVTGFFGQNVPYPGFGQRSGLWGSLIVTLVLSALVYLVFRRKRWL